MKIGYARVGPDDQNLAWQIDALKAAGCERIYQDMASGARTARPALDELLAQLRAGDVLVVCKLDRIGRSLKHLVELVSFLMKKKIGLWSLNDPIDTSSAQGQSPFQLFAALAEFERDLTRERTRTGLTAARARGRVGGRPKGLSPQAQATALTAEALYRERKLSVAAIAQQLQLSKSTLYSYLRYRGVEIGPYKTSMPQPLVAPPPEVVEQTPKVATILLSLRIENNSKFVRGKKRTIEQVERFYLTPFQAKQRDGGDYVLQVPYDTDETLDETVYELLNDIATTADDHHCFSESEAWMEGSERSW